MNLINAGFVYNNKGLHCWVVKGVDELGESNISQCSKKADFAIVTA